ncbi:MAG TPA: cobalamin-dependent protein [Methanoregula sp.]|nr:cobalamin-dependent protein [Methanoregula sp.]
MGKANIRSTGFLIRRERTSAQPKPSGTGTPAYRPVNLDTAALAGRAFERLLEKYPAMFRDASAYQQQRAVEDLKDHLGALQDALATGSPALLLDYACRAQVFFTARHLPGDYVTAGFRVLRELVRKDLPDDLRDDADRFCKLAIAGIRTAPEEPPPCIDDSNPLAGTARAYLDAVRNADREGARKIIAGAEASGVRPRDLYLSVFQPVLRETGRLWLIQRLSVAEEHFISASVEAEIARLHEWLAAEAKGAEKRGKTVVSATVEQDLHGIGIRMVTDFFELDGWDTYFTGANTPARSLLRAVRDRNADLVAISCTIPSRLPAVHYLIRSLRADPGTDRAKILVGGYPFMVLPGLWKQLGADACARDAEEAVAAADLLTRT